MSLTHTAAQMMGASAGPELLTVTHFAEVLSSCPGAPNFMVNYTARNFAEGDEVRISAVKDGGSPITLGSFPVVASGSHNFTWGARDEAPTVNVDIQARVEIRRGGATLSSMDSVATDHDIEDPATCPGDFT
jgi:hypothetical protein